MRTTRAVMSLSLGLAVSLLSGCVWLNNHKDKDIKVPPAVSMAKATPQSLVTYLNDNAKLTTSIRANMACAVMQKGKGLEPTGMMACQKPHDFRLRAKVMGLDQVDIVSNADEMSFWIKQADPKRQFVMKHKDLATGKAHAPFPFQPDMVLVALGMADYDPAAKYDLKVFDTTLELISDATSADGKPIKRTVVFRRKPVTGDESQIVGHVVKDASGKLICQATVDRVYRDRSGAVVPSVVTIKYPSEDVTMKLTLSNIAVNAITKEDSARLFTRTPIPGAEVYDLASRSVASPSDVSRAGYYPR